MVPPVFNFAAVSGSCAQVVFCKSSFVQTAAEPLYRLRYTDTLQRHEAEMSAQKVQVVALKQQLLDLEHAKESMAQVHTLRHSFALA